jgi:hypothetical protein
MEYLKKLIIKKKITLVLQDCKEKFAFLYSEFKKNNRVNDFFLHKKNPFLNLKFMRNEELSENCENAFIIFLGETTSPTDVKLCE